MNLLLLEMLKNYYSQNANQLKFILPIVDEYIVALGKVDDDDHARRNFIYWFIKNKNYLSCVGNKSCFKIGVFLLTKPMLP